MMPDVPPNDGCDRKLTNDNTAARLSEPQRRFLDAYRQSRLYVAPAARLAGVHRATVYRWLKDAAFTEAMREAAEQFFRENKAKVEAQMAERQRWRQQRERQRRPMRREMLARATPAKRR
jgi:hypothetical protein